MSESVNLTTEALQRIITAAVEAATTATRPSTSTQVVKADKPRRPQVSKNASTEQWCYFLSRWDRYKSMTGLCHDNEETVCHLLECCDDDLQLSLHRSFGSDITKKSEAEVLKEIRRFAVNEQRRLVCRNILRAMHQDKDEDIQHYAARVKGQADTCDYTVTCTKADCGNKISYADEEIKDQICMGLNDIEIQQDLLSHKDQTMNLEDTINYIAAKESGKRCHAELSTSLVLNKISPYQKLKRNSTINEQTPSKIWNKRKTDKDQVSNGEPCTWCGRTEESSQSHRISRKTLCPAYGKKCNLCGKLGHFQSVCRKRQPSSAISTDDDAVEDNPIFLGGIAPESCTDMSVAALLPFPHMEYNNESGWNATIPKEDPMLDINISLSEEAYAKNGLHCPPHTEVTLPAIADSGARTTVASVSLLQKLGLRVDDLFPVRQKLCGANNSQLNILGGLFITVSQTNSNAKSAQLLCYIQKDNLGKIYLSRTACEKLGIIPPDFPATMIANVEARKANDSSKECSCPLRQKPPKTVTSLPFPPTDDNREKLQQWLLEYYGASTFNVCEHQRLPLMTGPPLKLFLEPNAEPKAVHTPIPVPVHWQKTVKAGLDRDVELGVIEPVPWGTPTTWCFRMVTVGKKNGEPRRTVDLQPLNAVSSRQTHHTVSPFNQALSVPHNTKKTVCDAWNGFHSVPIRKEDRHLTTFITPWGRYRYCTAPQGYLAAGDAYTRRFDEIIEDIPNKTKCVDDTLLWASNIEENFFQTCEFLKRCGDNGITLNPKKFQFGKDEVEFAGFQISKCSVKPSSSLITAIEGFPVPKDITGIRSWFGLVNQVAYAFSTTQELEPFRDLLKPDRKFYWDKNLNELFEKSKKIIADKVRHGVKLFDPRKATCLFTDWSKTGTGFLLKQKYCNCQHDNVNCCETGWKVVLTGSKFNNSAESRYAPVEGECLAIVKALHKCRYFIQGCNDLRIATDHKPLLKVLGDRTLEEIYNPRLLNLKEKTLRYRYKLVHVPGRKNVGPDAISRYPADRADLGSLVETDMETIASSISVEADSYIHGLAISSLSSIDNLKTVTWARVKQAALKDGNMAELIKIILTGFPESINELPTYLKPYHKIRDKLSVTDSVVLYNERVVIPSSLRPLILENLHSAHQGVSSMISRAETCVYWPGITLDIERKRARCAPCNVMAPSNPSAQPTALPHPEYPFQMICADYFHYKGNNYIVVVDRYSNWPCVMKVAGGGSSKEFIQCIKSISEIFGIPEEISTDGGVQFTAYETKKFFEAWGIRHRISSVAFPHSNTRAELGVKTIKRTLVGNLREDGSLDSDRFKRALLQYKNTPDKETKLSPAQIVFGRAIRDFTPTVSKEYDPANVWRMTAEYRELALAKRHAIQRERLNEHTKELSPLHVGDSVYVQNQVGRYPNKWDKSGKIVEVKQYDQYYVKIDGSNRLSLRNRKFLRKFTPFKCEATQGSRGTLPPYAPCPDDTALYTPENVNSPSDFSQTVLEHESEIPGQSQSTTNVPTDLINNFTKSSNATDVATDVEATDPARHIASGSSQNFAQDMTEKQALAGKSAAESHPPLRRSSRARKQNSRLKDYVI